MDDSYSNERFYGDEKNEQDITGDNANNEEQGEASHKMRLSIDIHSIKEAGFKGLIYAKYTNIPTLGIKQFSTHPPIQITKSSEEKFPNSFCSYEFTSTKSRLYPTLTATNFEVEIWHQDRFKKDLLVGVAKIDIDKILRASIKKTSQSYVRVMDSWIPFDEVDEERIPKQRVGVVRVIIYLEDLGPSSYLKQHEEDVILKYKEQIGEEIPIIPSNIALRQLKEMEDPEKGNLLNEMGNLEYKIIWELENWKKAEEANFKHQLKTKEIEFLKKLSEDWKRKELEREKVFKKTEAQLQIVENDLKQKANKLQKREQKIVLLEEELKQRINETARQLAQKEEEITNIKKKFKDEKIQLEKEKNTAVFKYEELQNQIKKMEEEFTKFRKDQENSPIAIVKTELNAKLLEINELKKEVDKSNQIKEQYRIHYEKLKDEIIRMKKENEAIRNEMQRTHNVEMEQLKIKLGALAMMEGKDQIESIKNEFNEVRRQFEQSGKDSSMKNPFAKNIIDGGGNSMGSTAGKKRMQTINNQTFSHKENIRPNYDQSYGMNSEVARLLQERDELLKLGIYEEDDPLIITLNEQIEAAKYNRR